MSVEPLPESFAQYRDRHRGATIVVCGCGVSLASFAHPERFVTIGVNDVGRRFTPDYLVVVNERRQFERERYRYVEQTRAKAVFTQLRDLDLPQTRVVRFRLGRRGGTDRGDGATLHYANNSPYVAVQLARHLGAARIGLIGVDLCDDHFFGATGRHLLAGQLAQIDREYAALAAACRADGVELVNLSAVSRLTSLPKASPAVWGCGLGADAAATGKEAAGAGSSSDAGAASASCGVGDAPDVVRAQRRVFFVHYRFLSCGTVFETGLREAAEQAGIAHAHAYWDDAALPQTIERFAPDLVFVVHGRRHAQRWADTRLARRWRSAVWLLDEPYEVDDTSAWSHRFDIVFVNDAASLARHRNAHELPVAYAPRLHHGTPAGERSRASGFIGGANPSREALLSGLARRGLLDHVVGGPWRDARLAALCLAPNVPAERTATLYRETAIVLNVFRDRHHYNRFGLRANALNPRIVEALACGALVLSERRDGLEAVPELPTFGSEDEAAALITRFLADRDARLRVQRACAARLADATYLQRLGTVMALAFNPSSSGGALPRRAGTEAPGPVPPAASSCPADALAPAADGACADAAAVPGIACGGDPTAGGGQTVFHFDDDWDDIGRVVRVCDAAGIGDGCELAIEPGARRGAGFERGLASRSHFDGSVALSFEARLDAGAVLLAKVHQADRIDQTTNSYHLLVDERRAYLARHHHVFRALEPPRAGWTCWRIEYDDGVLALWRDGRLLHRVRDALLGGGHAFIGAQGGAVRLRALRLAPRFEAAAAARDRLVADGAETLLPVRSAQPPRVSIVTTVYDRVDCLRRCIASVRALQFHEYEHLIVADHPPRDVIERIRAAVTDANDPRIGLFDLPRRRNDWGIAPAAAGLRRARGEFVSFLSDDNGYLPDHFGPLLSAFERDPSLGFVYSSCQYDGRLVLAHPVPRPGRIDLGQPLWRRELFELHLGDDLPFDMMAWDWHLIDTLMRRGVRWRHVNRPSFIFRLAKYPRLIAPSSFEATVA